MINRKYWEEQAAELLADGSILMTASALESAVRIGRRDAELEERMRVIILIRDYARDINDDQIKILLQGIENNLGKL